MPCKPTVEMMPSARPDVGQAPVGAWMQRHFVYLAPTDTVAEATELMRFVRARHLLVVQEGILVGLLTYRDLLEAQSEAGAPRASRVAVALAGAGSGVTVAELMVRAPATIVASATLREAASRMLTLHLGCLPVVEPSPAGPRLIGIVTEADLLRAAYASAGRGV
ncbi:MAG TPA: CBS domain-containing protein [Myxococcota bacterium]|jgi:acetoin utilization protein AcuB|nr:CBS domain-containing protein [Myxococcota bacterium]